MMEEAKIAKDFCEWWNVGSLNDTGTRKACREDAANELAEQLRASYIRGLQRAAEIGNAEIERRYKRPPINCGGDDDYAERVEAIEYAFDNVIKHLVQSILAEAKAGKGE